MKKALKIVFITFLLFVIVLLITVTFIVNKVIKDSKDLILDKNMLINLIKEVSIYDNSDNEVKKSLTGNDLIRIEDLNKYTLDAFISIEDKDFYKHSGINFKRLLKATFNNLTSLSFKEGASTISQQLIKNTHLTNEKTLERKIKELILTQKLEKQFNKDAILETYLNIIYFGNGAYGIENASMNFFNKKASKLDISESATLAGIIKSPYKYSPIYNFENCLKRRNLVLNEMLKDNKITKEQYDEEINKDIVISEYDKLKNNNQKDLYHNSVLEEASEILNLSPDDVLSGNYKIYTYLDQEIQNLIVEKINEKAYFEKNEFGNIADGLEIIINNKTNGIVAFAGKSDYKLVNLKRQPGSAIKPILVYAPAIDNGQISACSQILDEETDFGGYCPHNVGGFHGFVTVRDCVAKSLNVPSVKILNEYGIKNAINFANKAGIEFDEKDNGLAIALGGFTHGISLKELTNSYTVFANNGNYKQAHFIKKITKNGIKLFENNNFKNKIIGDDTAYIITDLLKSSVEYGTSKKLSNLGFDVAGKTGTVALKNTNYNTDAISVAYTSEYTLGVWLGNYTLNKEFNLSSTNNGGTYATAILRDTLKDMYKSNKPADFKTPSSVVTVEIDINSMKNENKIKIANEFCPERYRQKEIFSKKFIPTEISDNYSNFNVENFKVQNYGKIENEITFTAMDYLKYEIYCIENNSEINIKTIENKKGDIIFVHKDLKADKKYEYFIKISNSYNEIYKISKKVVVYTPKINYEEILVKNLNNTQNNNLSWYFS